MEKPKRTEIKELGEFGLIRHLTQDVVPKNATTLSGIGDDAAVLRYGNKVVVITTDLLLEGIHFDLIYTPLKHLGYKAIIANLSDIYAMNAEPQQVIVAIGVSARFSVEQLDELYSGIKLACQRYGVDLVGGDTSSSLTGLTISITAIGQAREEDIVYRSGAKEGEVVCVTGDLGGAYVGLLLMEREKQIYLENPEIQPDIEGQEYIIGRLLKPEARKDIIHLFREYHIKPTAMIDVSDGVSSEMLHICEQSGVGCRLYEEKFPIDSNTLAMALKFNLDPVTCFLNGGEDYELLFTLTVDDYEKVKHSPDITAIGYTTSKQAGAKLITRSGREYDLVAQGWNAFRTENKIANKSQ